MARQGWGGGPGYLFPIHILSGSCKARYHIYICMGVPARPGHHGAKQVFARLLPVCDVKALYYLSDCWVLYVRKAAAVCALEACVLQSQPGKQAHLRLPTRERRSQRCDFLLRFCLQHPFPSLFLFSMLGGPPWLCTSGHLVRGSQCWDHGMGGPQQPDLCAHFVRPWTQTHDAPGFRELSGRWGNQT